jgi:hypothetical protein
MAMVRDGVSGVGTILWQAPVVLSATTTFSVTKLFPINVVGSPDTAMTVELSAAAANSITGVSLSGTEEY